MERLSNTVVEYRCSGHCYGIQKCPYAEVYMEDSKIISIKCKLPKKIGEGVYLFE